MVLIADILLIAGALGAAIYCGVLSRRLRRFNDLEKGMGGAIAVLSGQVDDLTQTLQAARTAAEGSVSALDRQSTRAEAAAKRLELMMASMHDLPEAEQSSETPPIFRAARIGAQAPAVAPAEDSATPSFLSRRRRAEAAE